MSRKNCPLNYLIPPPPKIPIFGFELGVSGVVFVFLWIFGIFCVFFWDFSVFWYFWDFWDFKNFWYFCKVYRRNVQKNLGHVSYILYRPDRILLTNSFSGSNTGSKPGYPLIRRKFSQNVLKWPKIDVERSMLYRKHSLHCIYIAYRECWTFTKLGFFEKLWKMGP